MGHWGWVKFPAGFDVRSADEPLTYGLFWLDPAQRERELKEFRAGETKGPPRSVIEDAFRVN